MNGAARRLDFPAPLKAFLESRENKNYYLSTMRLRAIGCGRSRTETEILRLWRSRCLCDPTSLNHWLMCINQWLSLAADSLPHFAHAKDGRQAGLCLSTEAGAEAEREEDIDGGRAGGAVQLASSRGGNFHAVRTQVVDGKESADRRKAQDFGGVAGCIAYMAALWRRGLTASENPGTTGGACRTHARGAFADRAASILA